MTPADPDLEQVVARELRLLDPEVRADVPAVTALLHPDFEEYGASGRVWDRASIVAALSGDPGVSGTADDVRATRLADEVVLVTYRVAGERTTLRSSVWVLDGGEWRIRFHQGTPAAPMR